MSIIVIAEQFEHVDVPAERTRTTTYFR